MNGVLVVRQLVCNRVRVYGEFVSPHDVHNYIHVFIWSLRPVERINQRGTKHRPSAH